MTAYGVLLLAALVAGWWLARESGEIEPAHVDWMAPLLVAAGLAGAWAFARMEGAPAGSRGLFGGLLAAAGAGIAYAVFRGLLLGAVGDAFAPALALGIAIGRVGCFLAGCCAGTPTDVAWAVDGRHPVQLYESLGALLLCRVVLAARRLRRVPGEAFLAFGAGYGILRFGLEFLRANHAPVAARLTLHQWTAAAAVMTCTALFVVRRRMVPGVGASS